MYLRDIKLDLPYREKQENIKSIMNKYNCGYERAVEIDYDTNWMLKIRRRFELESRCIASMFIRLLGKYKTKDCSRIIIDCVGKETQIDYSCNMGICLVQYEFDYESFFEKSNYEKKRIILEIIKACICRIGNEKNWDLAPLNKVINKIEELDYNNFWMFGKKVKSPNKLYTAELYIEYEVEKIDFFAIIRNKQDEIVKRILIISDKPSEWKYVQYLGKLVWTSETEIQLRDKADYTLFNISV